MGATFSRSKTFVAGEILTATNLNGIETNILNNLTPAGMDDYSADVVTMRVVTDPYPAGVESLATSAQGELERIRYLIKQITNQAQWYIDPVLTLTDVPGLASDNRLTGHNTFQGRINKATSVAGTVDAITAVHSPTFTAWVDGMRGTFRAAGANTSTTPTFAPDGLAAKTFVKENLAALVANDIAGAGHEVEWIYNSTADKVVMINPKSSGAAATQAEQEAASSTTVMTTPGRQHFNPSAAKAWVMFNGTGTPAVIAGYNVSSITDNAVGYYIINFTTAFSSANYACVGGALHDVTTSISYMVKFAYQVAESISVMVTQLSGVTTHATYDITNIYAVCYGDQ